MLVYRYRKQYWISNLLLLVIMKLRIKDLKRQYGGQSACFAGDQPRFDTGTTYIPPSAKV